MKTLKKQNFYLRHQLILNEINSIRKKYKNNIILREDIVEFVEAQQKDFEETFIFNQNNIKKEFLKKIDVNNIYKKFSFENNYRNIFSGKNIIVGKITIDSLMLLLYWFHSIGNSDESIKIEDNNLYFINREKVHKGWNKLSKKYNINIINKYYYAFHS